MEIPECAVIFPRLVPGFSKITYITHVENPHWDRAGKRCVVQRRGESWKIVSFIIRLVTLLDLELYCDSPAAPRLRDVRALTSCTGTLTLLLKPQGIKLTHGARARQVNIKLPALFVTLTFRVLETFCTWRSLEDMSQQGGPLHSAAFFSHRFQRGEKMQCCAFKLVYGSHNIQRCSPKQISTLFPRLSSTQNHKQRICCICLVPNERETVETGRKTSKCHLKMAHVNSKD